MKFQQKWQTSRTTSYLTDRPLEPGSKTGAKERAGFMEAPKIKDKKKAVVADGYYVFLHPLSSVKHDIGFKAVSVQFTTTGIGNVAQNLVYH